MAFARVVAEKTQGFAQPVFQHLAGDGVVVDGVQGRAVLWVESARARISPRVVREVMTSASSFTCSKVGRPASRAAANAGSNSAVDAMDCARQPYAMASAVKSGLNR